MDGLSRCGSGRAAIGHCRSGDAGRVDLRRGQAVIRGGLESLRQRRAIGSIARLGWRSYDSTAARHHNGQFSPPDESGAPPPAGVSTPPNFAYGVVSPLDNALGFDIHPLPAPWFIYAFMGIGILVCCITFIGHIGAEAINGCCLCFYAVLSTLFILLEVGLVAFIALDHNWEKDIPFDPTGELDNFRTFIEDNVDVFMWIGIALVVIQVLSLLFAIVLRSLVSSRREDDDDIEEDYEFRSRIREPLLAPYSTQASMSARGDSDIWSSRMREKYRLNQNPSIEAKQ